MKKITNFFDKYIDQIFIVCISSAIITVLCIVIFAIGNIYSLKTQQNYIAYDVIAAADETYVLQECDDREHYIEVDQSEMYNVGDTVLVSYSNDEITSIWLYVDYWER